MGLRQLVVSDSLTKAAEWKAAHMANYGYFSHSDEAPPVDRTWDQRIEDCGYTYGMGENIAYGYRSPLAVVEGWIGSPGHRENLEEGDYKVIGVAAALDDEGTPYWVQIFGTAIDASVQQDPAPAGEPAVVEQPDEGDGFSQDETDGWAEAPADGDDPAEDWSGDDQADDSTTASPFRRRGEVRFRNPWRWRFGR
jgi:hypothetical protein